MGAAQGAGAGVTFRELFAQLSEMVATVEDDVLDREVIIRVGVANGHDDEDLHVGGLRSAVLDYGCTDEVALTLDGDQHEDSE